MPALTRSASSSSAASVLFTDLATVERVASVRVRMDPVEIRSEAASTGGGKTASEARERQWLTFVRSVAADGVLAAHVSSGVEQMWRHLRPLARDVAVPRAAVSELGGLFMVWEFGPHHLEIEVNPSGRYDWFYSNFRTGEHGGAEELPVSFLAPELAAQFRLVAEHYDVNA